MPLSTDLRARLLRCILENRAELADLIVAVLPEALGNAGGLGESAEKLRLRAVIVARVPELDPVLADVFIAGFLTPTPAADGDILAAATQSEASQSPGLGGVIVRRRGGRRLFQRTGRTWKVVFDGAPEFHIEDSLGARYLDYLVHHANETISAYELEVAITPEKGTVRLPTSSQAALDGKAVRAALRELDRERAGGIRRRTRGIGGWLIS